MKIINELNRVTDIADTNSLEITPVAIEEEMKRSYLDYAMSVIVSRALPDVRDGLKPVHRRILYAMKEGGYDWNRPFRKSARVVGDVMGKYHPHGDGAIYDAMVRMAQDFSMRLTLVDGQGNFGSMDGDPPAAMRYTEARLTKSASLLLESIEKETVDFQPNYDDSTLEPSVLPAPYPNLLVNGAGGIAVGMATNIPPHNLGEVIDGCCAYLDNPEITTEELMTIIPGPDFPTGGMILGRQGIFDAYRTGRGSIVMRAVTKIEEIRKDREAIIITEIPYQVNKARLMEKIAETVSDKTIEGISDLRDESDRHGVRVVVEIKRDANAEVVLNQLFRYTPLQTSFGANILALNGGKPEVMLLKDILAAFLEFREQVIRRRTIYDLRKARERAHILVGLAIAVANIDEMIDLIRTSTDPVDAREKLIGKVWPAKDVTPIIQLIDEPGHVVAEDGTYQLTEAQAKAILELRLQRLTGLERDKIDEELKELVAKITDFIDILDSRDRLLSVLRTEIMAFREEFATPRRTQIAEGDFSQDMEALIQREEMVVTVSHGGYIKRTALSTYRAQKRGGRGRTGMSTKDEDFVSQLFVANTHTPMLFFTSRGIAHKMKVYQLPLGNPQSKGKAMVNLLPLAEGETISTIMPLPEEEDAWDTLSILFATAGGSVRRNNLSEFKRVQRNGKIAMKLEDEDGNAVDRLIGVATCSNLDDVMLASRGGKCIRFPVEKLRVFNSRASTGVRGIDLAEGDEVISLSILKHVEADSTERDLYLKAATQLRRAEGEETLTDFIADGISEEKLTDMQGDEQFLLTVSESGFGKRSSAYDYRITNRGGQGIANIEMSERNGEVVATFPVSDDDQIMLVTNGGQIIRCPVNDIRIAARRTQGVRLFRVAGDEKVVSVSRVCDPDDDVAEHTEGVSENMDQTSTADQQQQNSAGSETEE